MRIPIEGLTSTSPSQTRVSRPSPVDRVNRGYHRLWLLSRTYPDPIPVSCPVEYHGLWLLSWDPIPMNCPVKYHGLWLLSWDLIPVSCPVEYHRLQLVLRWICLGLLPVGLQLLRWTKTRSLGAPGNMIPIVCSAHHSVMGSRGAKIAMMATTLSHHPLPPGAAEIVVLTGTRLFHHSVSVAKNSAMIK